jgi:hypothetical protein
MSAPSKPKEVRHKTQILTCDRRGQIDIAELNQALGLVFDRTLALVDTAGETNTQQDATTVVFAEVRRVVV